LKFISGSGQPLNVDLPQGPQLNNGFMAWDPDGNRLAAVSVTGNGNAIIWIVEPQGREPFRRLMELPGAVRPRGITWTIDGSSLIFGRQEAISDLVVCARWCV
jgi:Tol biopolymer transport system component